MTHVHLSQTLQEDHERHIIRDTIIYGGKDHVNEDLKSIKI